MRGTIRKLFGATVFLLLCSLASFYIGSRHAAVQTPTPDNPLAGQFFSDSGDGLLLAGGFLMLIALAVAFAAAMLWMRERQGE
jgi:hypothetical protein